jgi:hypothetical protein
LAHALAQKLVGRSTSAENRLGVISSRLAEIERRFGTADIEARLDLAEHLLFDHKLVSFCQPWRNDVGS